MAKFFNQSDNLMFYGVAAGNVPGVLSHMGYIGQIVVPPQRAWLLSGFGLKMGREFDLFVLK